MAAQEQQIDYQNLLNKYHPRCPEGLLGVLVFEGKALTASSGSMPPASLDGFPPPAASQKINARRVNEQPCLVYSDLLPDNKQICLIFPVHMRLTALRQQASQIVQELRSLSQPTSSALTSREEAVLAEFIQAAVNSKYAQDAESHTQPVRVSQAQTTSNSAQSATQALYWTYWYQVF